MTTGPAGNRYGVRGGGWAPDLVDGQLPYGVVDGVRKTCPTPLFVRCFCGYWWVAPSTAAKPCDRCGEHFVRVTVQPGQVA